MDVNRLRELLAQVSAGTVSAEEALELLRSLPFEDLGFAKVDHHRSLRTGFPEVIFGSGKTADQVIEIARRLNDKAQNVLITRLGPAEAEQVRRAFPEMSYSEHARVGTIVHSLPEIVGRGVVLVVAAGTSDVPVAEEAALTAELLGNTTERLYDVGISGIHRLFAYRDKLRQAAVLVVVAGMEGALPSVVGRPRRSSRHRRAHQYRLRRQLRRTGGIARHAQLLRRRRAGGEHRQRLRRGGGRESDQ